VRSAWNSHVYLVTTRYKRHSNHICGGPHRWLQRR